MMTCSMPAATASSTAYWMIGLSTSGSISLGCALVAGRNRVPQPAAGKTALRTRIEPRTCEGGDARSIPRGSGPTVRTRVAGGARRSVAVEAVLDGVQRGLGPAGQAELGEDVGDVRPRRPLGDAEASRDGPVGEPVGRPARGPRARAASACRVVRGRRAARPGRAQPTGDDRGDRRVEVDLAVVRGADRGGDVVRARRP